MSRLRRVVLILVPALALAGAGVYLSLDRILKSTVEKQSTQSLGLSTTLNGAHLSLLGGKVNLSHLRIASPRGFSAPQMFELGDTALSVRYGQLRKDPIHVDSLTLDQPRLVIEQSNGAINFRKAMDLVPAHESSPSQPIKLIIDELKVLNAQVVIHPGLPGVREEIAAAIPGDLGNKLSKVVEDPQALAKDPGKVLQQDVSGILGGNKTTKPATAGRAGAPRKR
jgi:uncharacterized protein involved in outer membrane biogenesis